MGYAEVAVNSPIAQRRTYSYNIPPGLTIVPGQAVWVPFGLRVIQGIVLELTDFPAVDQTRDLAGIIDPKPLLAAFQIDLARWISEQYLSPIFDAISLMLPPGFEQKLVTYLELTGRDPSSDELRDMLPDERSVLRELVQGRQALATVEKSLGKRRTRAATESLQRKGLVAVCTELDRARLKPKIVCHVKLGVSPAEAIEAAATLKSTKQAALLRFLTAGDQKSVQLNEAVKASGSTRVAARRLEEQGLITTESVEVRRDLLSSLSLPLTFPPVPTTAQVSAMQSIRQSIKSDKEGGRFLLYGVTGSGKTEVYLGALAEAIAQGKKCIVLVPEIALTPQTIQRFAGRFPGRVAVLHSQLTPREQFDVWQDIASGTFDVVIGPRSALFAPQPDLGLIVLDEEHEWTYKQNDSPRYHAREVALKLASLISATVVLGSATPDVESFYRACIGEFGLLQLPYRIAVREDTSRATPEIVDMRQELKEGNRSLFSRTLREALARSLASREQAILFLNRRGTATFVQCRDCGTVLRCSSCDLPFTYHGSEETLVCHQCSRRRGIPGECPGCGSKRIRYMGAGTRKVEEEAARLFPGARLLRWDRDAVRDKDSHGEMLAKFANREADILIGTQMIAKGLDFPEVTLVGIISADTILNFPDFRSCERAFQLLCQVSGRAGRGLKPGRAIVQTYAPDHYAVQYGAQQDYDLFYEREIRYRREHRNPPFARLASIVNTHVNDSACGREAEKIKTRLQAVIEAQGLEVELIGPAPMFFRRVRGHYRWQLVLRGWDLNSLLAWLVLPKGCTIDIDPLYLL